jgi:2',3'-cyclic-nucleotide 2'-phosphodiesterase/3'-nucleotidase/5'-nucleotidase
VSLHLKKASFFLGLLLCLTIGIFTTQIKTVKAQSSDPVLADNAVKIEDNKIVIEIISINDFHGALNKNGKNVGIANLVNEIKAQKASNPNTIFVSAGDLFQGSAESNLLYGQPVAACLKEAGLVASAIGNHEYDWGNNRFAGWENEGGFAFLAANIYDRNTKKPVTYAKPYLIVNLSGIKIALIGLTTPETAYKTTLTNVETVEFKNPVEVLPQYIKEVRSQGANLVIALSHLGAIQDKSGVITGEAAELAQVPGLDGIIAGHSHEIIAGKVGNIPLVMAYYNGRSLGKLTFTLDKTTAKLVTAQASLDHLYLRQDTLREDKATKTILDKYMAPVQSILSETIGETKVDLNHNAKEPSLMGEWVCQVMREQTKTQIAFQNGGGLRVSLPQGKLTVGNLYTLMPFDNTLVTAKLTGAQVKEVIENGLANPNLNYFGQTAGLYVVYDLNKPFGQRVVKITLANGQPLKMTNYYTVVANDFMFSGGDQYITLTKAKDIKDTGIPVRDVLIDYIKTHKVISPIYKGYQTPANETIAVKPAA